MKKGRSVDILNHTKKFYVVIDEKEKVLYVLIRTKDNEISVKLNRKEAVRLTKCIKAIWNDDFKITKTIKREDSRDIIELSYVKYKNKEMCKIELYNYIGHCKMEAEYAYDKVTMDKDNSRKLFCILADYTNRIA